MKVLIAYASSKGSTLSIAEYIHTRLEASGLSASLLPISPELSPEHYDAVIIGSCIHAGHWLSRATTFLSKNVKYFSAHPNIPIYAFSVGMPALGKAEAKEEGEMEMRIRRYVDTRGHKLFQGYWRLSDMWVGVRWCFGCCMGEGEDRRDWVVVEGWADKVAKELRTEHPDGGTHH